jgi:rare lipoprotein A
MALMRSARLMLAAMLFAVPLPAQEEPPPGDEPFLIETEVVPCPAEDPEAIPHPLPQRLLKYGLMADKHRVKGLASYYSSFFDGRKTANGEIFRNRRYSAAHLTLPLGCWVEVTSRATGRKLRLRVNDRGPYVRKFVLDLSQAAARYLGVDKARDRYVEFRVIALPGEEPLPEELARLSPGS